MEYRPDPGGVFASDAHRQVLSHLSDPSQQTGYTVEGLHEHLGALEHLDHARQILIELVADGHVDERGGVYRQSEQGHARLTGPIANEPPPVGPELDAHLAEHGIEVQPATVGLGVPQLKAQAPAPSASSAPIPYPEG